jgi:xanthine dehydrogenase accessory factor
MDEVLSTVRRWLDQGEAAALATIVSVERKAPRGPGAAMAVGAGGEVVGSLSGGCVEPALVEDAASAIASGAARLVSFGISDDQAFGIGLSCGGTLHVFLDPLAPRAGGAALLGALEESLEGGGAAALVTVLGGAEATAPGAKLVVFEDARAGTAGSTGSPDLDGRLADRARGLLARGASERIEVDGADVFVRSFYPPPTLYVIGAVHPAAELCRAGKLVGFRVVVCDPRSPFATPERLPAADEIAREWPDVYLAKQRLGARDAVCVLTHDLKFDVPAIRAALEAGAGYVGAMGSRKTQARRVERLREEGVAEEEIDRVSSPIGLDLGGDEPGEIAVAIVAEIVARRHGKAGRTEPARTKGLA